MIHIKLGTCVERCAPGLGSTTHISGYDAAVYFCAVHQGPPREPKIARRSRAPKRQT